MNREHASGGNFVIALILFVLIAASGVLLLITALVEWLSVLTGSTIAATLIVSGVCFLIALAIYLLSLHKPLAHMQDKVETVYDVARTAREGYEWVMDKIEMLRLLRDALREK